MNNRIHKFGGINMSKVTEINHPLILHKLAILRDEKTGSKEFRHLVEEISMLMAYEVTRDLSTEEVEVKTPVSLTKCKMLSGKKDRKSVV